MRDQTTSVEAYRQAVNQLGQLVAIESGQFLPKLQNPVKTPMDFTEGTYLAHEPILIPVLRSGLILLPPFLHMYPKAAVGILGIQRDEITAAPHFYYSKLPDFPPNTPIFILDPMIATGGTAIEAVKILKKAGAEEKEIVLISILASQQGLNLFKKTYPSIRTQIVHIDPKLNSKKMIVPGLGDFGDRYFAT